MSVCSHELPGKFESRDWIRDCQAVLAWYEEERTPHGDFYLM